MVESESKYTQNPPMRISHNDALFFHPFNHHIVITYILKFNKSSFNLHVLNKHLYQVTHTYSSCTRANNCYVSINSPMLDYVP